MNRLYASAFLHRWFFGLLMHDGKYTRDIESKVNIAVEPVATGFSDKTFLNH